MNWPRVKTILIFLFLVVDLILLATIIVPSVSMSRIPQETIQTTAELLSSQGVKISPDIIPFRRESMGIVELYNIWPDRPQLAQSLIGSSEPSETGVFKNNTKTLTLSENSFKYETLNDGKSIAHQLLELGIDLRENAYIQGDSSLRGWQTTDGKKIFESEIYAAQTDSLFSVSGYWIFSDKKKGAIKNTPDTLVDVTGVLIDFLNNPLRESNITIISIELGYSTGSAFRDTTHKLVSVSPAYKISTDSGAYYIYDALSGDFLYAFIDSEVKY